MRRARLFRSFREGGPQRFRVGSDRGREGFRLPSLRTVRAVFPHTALQSGVSSSRLSRRQPGRVKREQPGFREEGIWPALMIGAACPMLDDASPVCGEGRVAVGG